MHTSYADIVSRIAEPPSWWLDGVPRYDEFHPGRVWAHTEVLLVHIRCQLCERDFRVALTGCKVPGQTYRGLLVTQRQLGIVGDPPNHGCTGDTMSADEVAVLEFWARFLTETRGYQDWRRIPEFERSLEVSDEAILEAHLEAWSRIRRFRARPEGLMGSWAPTAPAPPEFPVSKPSPHTDPSPETGKFIDMPELNRRRRLALLALSGRISAAEFADLQSQPQQQYNSYEERPAAARPAWAEHLAEDVRAVDETILANAIKGYREMSPEQREERYCNGLDRILFELAISGRMTPEERMQILAALIPNLYNK